MRQKMAVKYVNQRSAVINIKRNWSEEIEKAVN